MSTSKSKRLWWFLFASALGCLSFRLCILLDSPLMELWKAGEWIIIPILLLLLSLFQLWRSYRREPIFWKNRAQLSLRECILLTVVFPFLCWANLQWNWDGYNNWRLEEAVILAAVISFVLCAALGAGLAYAHAIGHSSGIGKIIIAIKIVFSWVILITWGD